MKTSFKVGETVEIRANENEPVGVKGLITKKERGKSYVTFTYNGVTQQGIFNDGELIKIKK